MDLSERVTDPFQESQGLEPDIYMRATPIVLTKPSSLYARLQFDQQEIPRPIRFLDAALNFST
eukprot:749092-Hanusia_phi.AAC.8